MKKSAVAVLLIGTALSSPGVLAQYPAAGGMHGGMGGGQGMRGTTRDRTPPEDVGAPVQVQLDHLEDDLKLNPEQRKLWNTYADKVLSFADDMTRARFEARTSSVQADATAAQQLDRLADKARNRSTAVEDIAASGKALYAVLSSDQRVIADRRLVVPVLSLAVGLPLPGAGATSFRGQR